MQFITLADDRDTLNDYQPIISFNVVDTMIMVLVGFDQRAVRHRAINITGLSKYRCRNTIGEQMLIHGSEASY